MGKKMISEKDREMLIRHYEDEIVKEFPKYFDGEQKFEPIRHTTEKYLELKGSNDKMIDGVVGNMDWRKLWLGDLAIRLTNGCHNYLNRLDELLDEIARDVPSEDSREKIQTDIHSDLYSLSARANKKIYASDFDDEPKCKSIKR